MQGACGSDKTRLETSDSDFTYYGVYSFYIFGVFLNRFLPNHSKASFETFIVIQNEIRKIEVLSEIEKTRDSSYYVIHAP